MSTRVLMQQSRIQQFYKDKVIFLTGGSGFLGKILIEKFLRSCVDINKIYLLMREKNGISSETRLHSLAEDAVFTRLRKEQSNFVDRLKVLHGDLDKPRLGLDEADQDLIKQTVDVVIHSGATVRFDEALRTSIITNVGATKEICLLAQEIRNLKSFVHVSTAYANSELPVIEEKVYPPSIPPDSLLGLAELLDTKLLDQLTPTLLGAKFNTYTYTKSAGEEVVNQFKSTLPAAILRPCIVTGSAAEPYPGWVDNQQTLTKLVATCSTGLLRTIRCDGRHMLSNSVPVDFNANAIIALAYAVATSQSDRSTEGKELLVVNCSPPDANNITMGQMFELIMKHVRRNPLPTVKWYPFFLYPRTSWGASVQRTLLHDWRGRTIDFLSALFGRPTRLTRRYAGLHRHCNMMEPFFIVRNRFEEENLRKLWKSLEPADQKLFAFNMADFKWDSYVSDYVKGCRQYVQKEDPATIEKGRRRIRVLYLIHQVTKGSFLLMTGTAIWSAASGMIV